MDNSFMLEIIAKLNKQLSKNAIKNDLKTLNNTMYVRVLARLSKTLAKNELKKQLRELNDLYINVETKVKTGKNTKAQIQRNIKELLQTISDLEIGIKATKINRDIENVRSRVQKKVQSSPISFNLEIKKSKLISDIEYLGKRYSKLFSNVSASNKYENILNNAYNVSNKQQLADTRAELEAFTSELKANGLAAQSAAAKWSKLIDRAKELFSAAAIVRIIFTQVRQAVSTVIDLDKVYTDLIKVNDQLERGNYAEYLSECNKRAKELATTQKALIEGATEFSKSGYDLSMSDQLTEISTILSNVGDMSASDSAKAIISGVQAYDVVDGYTDVVDKAKILVDIYNEIGNTASITTAEIAQGVQSVGSVFSDANTSAQEFISLLAAGNRQYQDADSLALGLRTAALRIRGCTSELAAMGEETDDVYTSASKLADEIRGLTNINGSGGVRILEADGETFRSIYDIFLDISKVYQQMSDMDASALLELIAGKNRASAISAVLNNMSEAQEIYQRSLNAAGSAQEEYNKYLESTEAHIKQFQATLVETYTSFINGDMVSHMADIGTVILDLNNKTGLLQHTLIAIATLKIGESITSIGGAIAGTISQMNTLGSAIQQVKNLPLDDVLRRDALDDLGEATKSLTEKNLKLLLSQKGLEESDRIAVLRKHDLTEADALAKLEKLGLTDATKKNTAANIVNAGSANVSSVAFKGLAASIRNVWAAMSLLEKASIIFAAVSTAWSVYSMIVDKNNQKLDKARERTSELFDEFKNLNDTLSDHKKTVSELADRYDELAQGVNRLNNQNISLSTDEYQEFLSINKQLANSFPSLSRGIDENGNSILSLGTKGITAKEQLKELLQVEEDLNNFRIAQGLDEAFDGVFTYIDDANKSSDELNDSFSDVNKSISELQDIIDNGIDLSNTSSDLLFSGSHFDNNNSAVRYLNALNQAAQEFFDTLDVNRATELRDLNLNELTLFNAEESNDGTGAFKVYSNLYELTNDEVVALENIVKANVANINGTLKDEFDAQQQETQATIQQAENAWTDFIPNLVAGMKSKQTFKNLDSDLQDIAVQIVGGLDYSFATAMNEYDPNDPYAYIRDKFIVPLGNLSDSDKKSFVDAYNNLFTIDTSDISVDEIEQLTNKYISTIADILDEDPVELGVIFGIDNSNIDNLKNRVQNILKDAFDDRVGELSFGDLQIAAKLEVSAGTLLSWDELIDKIEEVKNMSFDGESPTFDITAHKDSIDDFQAKLKTLGDILSSIQSGNFENSDLTDLLQEFPELADKTDDLETAIVELINNALQALYDTLGEDIPDGLKTSLQDLADIASGTAKHLGDAFSDIHDSWDILHDFKDTMDKGFDSNVTDSLLQSVRKLSGELETLVAGYYSGVVTAEQLYEALTEHYENDLHNYSEALIKKNELSTEFYNAVGLASEEVTNQFYDDYQVDIKNCTTYNHAKIEIEKQTLGQISAMWSQYYDAQSKTLKMSMSEIEARATHGGGDAKAFLEQYELIEKYEAAMEALNNITYDGIRSNFEKIGSKLGANGSGSGSSSDFEETFDWIETAIDRIERSISNLDLKASSVYRSWSERNSNLKAELLDVKKEMDIQASGYNKYMQQANSVGLSEEWANKVRNGQIDINSITDKALAEQIKQYQEYYEKAIACQDAVESLRESVSKLYETAFDNIVSQFDNIVSVIENSKSMLDEQINQAEERGYIANVAYYEALIKVEQKNIEQLTKERTSLQSALADAVSNGAIAEGSQEWADMQSQIDDVTLAIEQANTAMIKYGNSIRDIQWQIFDLIQDRISRISSESDFLINLLSYDKQYDDRGQLTDTGMSTVGLHGMNYNVYMAQADKYAEEMLRIDKELAEDPYNQDLYNRRQELLELQQEMIIAAEDEKQAIVDMVEEGINREIESLQSLIDAYAEALDSQKSLYDYSIKMSDLTKEQASLQKMLSAYENDLSEESKQKIQQIKVRLEENAQEIEQNEYEKFINDSKKLLDDLMLEYSEALNQRLDNIDALIADMIASSNANAGMISDTLSSKADSVGYYLSESMEDIWNTNTGSMLDALAMYDSNIMGGFAEVNTSVGEVIRGVTETVSGIGNVNTTINNAISSVTGNMQAILDKLSVISTMQSSSAASSYYGGSGGTSSSGSSGTGSSGSGSSGLGGNGGSGFFVYKKDNYPKGSLNINSSIIDRLKYHDFDSSFSMRSRYYSAMGFSGTYTGTDAQNAKMLDWMKLNGYKNGVLNAKKAELAWTQEGGKPEIIVHPDGSIERSDGSILTPVNPGDSIFPAEASKNLWNFAVDPSQFLRNVMGLNSLPAPTQNNQTVNMGGVELNVNVPNATNWPEIKRGIMTDRQITEFMQDVTVRKPTGGSMFRKNHI